MYVNIKRLLRNAYRRFLPRPNAALNLPASTAAIEKALDSLSPHYRTALLSMYRVEPQIGLDGQLHPIDGVTKISPTEGMWLYNFCLTEKPKAILEIGMAYGFSTLYLLAALSKIGHGNLTSIDPGQKSSWNGIGLMHAKDHCRRVGSDASFRFIEDRSDRAAVDLLRALSRFDLIFIDGDHRFDSVLVDFHMYSQLCPIGGHLIFDDMWMSSIKTAISFIRTNRKDFIEVHATEQNIAVFKKISSDSRPWSQFTSFSVSNSTR